MRLIQMKYSFMLDVALLDEVVLGEPVPLWYTCLENHSEVYFVHHMTT